VTFEEAFAAIERVAEAATKATSALLDVAKDLSKASKDGDIARIQKCSERFPKAIEAARQAIDETREAWPFSEEAEEAYLRDQYLDELLILGEKAGLLMHRRETALLVPPSVVRVMPNERAIRLGNRRLSSLRPSALIGILRTARSRKTKFNGQRFLEALHSAYQLVKQKEAGTQRVLAAKIYGALTLLPGASSDYTRDDFAQDLFLLEQSNLRATKTGATLHLHPPSTASKDRHLLFTYIGPDGSQYVYATIEFTELASRE
jgi:hypothetical protein